MRSRHTYYYFVFTSINTMPKLATTKATPTDQRNSNVPMATAVPFVRAKAVATKRKCKVGKCQAKTKLGAQCGNCVKAGTDFCYLHKGGARKRVAPTSASGSEAKKHKGTKATKKRAAPTSATGDSKRSRVSEI